jgi:hypothetical protein
MRTAAEWETEARLVQALRRGDEDAFTALVRRECAAPDMFLGAPLPAAPRDLSLDSVGR